MPPGPHHHSLLLLVLPLLVVVVQGVKKPYNPIIGETFACFWKHPDGSRSQYFAEQVLHRPPISAIYFENRDHNLHATAHVWTKSQFAAPQVRRCQLPTAAELPPRASASTTTICPLLVSICPLTRLPVCLPVCACCRP